VPQKRCFVISPIGEEGSEFREHADRVLRHIIEPAMNELDVVPVRSDQMTEPGRISQQMFREILVSDLCVAVLTFLNPNVFYELAFAQCASQPVVILLQKGSKLPFDIQDLRVIEYDFDIDTVPRAKQALVDQVREMFKPGWEQYNPLEVSREVLTPDQRGLIHQAVESRPAVLPPKIDAAYSLPTDPGRRIVVRAGDVQYVRDVDVLVSSENTDLQLSRYFEGSMSGTLRFLDAQKDAGGTVIRDSLYETLQSEIARLAIDPPVLAGTVVATPTDGLRKHGAKYVFHTAAVRGEVGRGYVPVVDRIPACVTNAYERFADLAAAAPEGEPLRTILFPVLGAGSAGLDPVDAVRSMLPYILTSMQSTTACRETHLLVRIESHLAAARAVAEEYGLKEE